jgi:hypothetical protein
MSKDLLLLNAFRRDAKDDFLEKGELLVVATDDCAEWANGALNLRLVAVVL